MREDEKTRFESLHEIEKLQRRVEYLEKSRIALRRERQKLYTLLDTIPGFVFLRAPDFSIRFANRYFLEHFGDPEGKTCHEIMAGRAEPCEECRLLAVCKTKKPQKWEWTSRVNNRVYQIYDYPFIDVDGQLLVLEFGIDITELKEKDAQINHISRKSKEKESLMLRQSRQALMGEMIGNIAHEWRQPLHIIALLIQDLKECYLHGSFSIEYLDNAVNSVMDVIQYMSHTIDDFSNFFKPEKQSKLFAVSDTVEKTLTFLKPELKRSKIQFEVDVPHDLTIIGYPNEYAHVLLNLIKNAKEVFAERKIEKPKLVIKGFRENKKIIVTVTDNAGGIPDHVIDKIFDPYFSTKNTGSGLGIGLYMSRIIIEQNMKGKMQVRNVEKGAEFRIEVLTSYAEG